MLFKQGFGLKKFSKNKISNKMYMEHGNIKQNKLSKHSNVFYATSYHLLETE